MSNKANDDDPPLNAQLVWFVERIAVAAERMAIALERQAKTMEEAAGADPNAEREAASLSKDELEKRIDSWTEQEENQFHMIEQLEEQGIPVPAAAYKRLGLDPPEREDEPELDGGKQEEERADGTGADVEGDQPGGGGGSGE